MLDMASRWTIEPLRSPSEIDDILAVEQASFSNPWTRDMYLAELDHKDVSFLYLARDAKRQRHRFLFVLAGPRRAPHQ